MLDGEHLVPIRLQSRNDLAEARSVAPKAMAKTIAGFEVEAIVFVFFWLNASEGKSCFRQ
jgi:hypothetical protein